jgi:hypothetical protein
MARRSLLSFKESEEDEEETPEVFPNPKRRSLTGRSLLAIDNETASGNVTVVDTSYDPMHPCYSIRMLMENETNTAAVTYLMHQEYRSCMYSALVAKFIDTLMFGSPNASIVPPKFLMNSPNFLTTLINVVRGSSMGISYVSHVMTNWAIKEEVGNATQLNGTLGLYTQDNVTDWPTYASENGVTDELSIRIGQFFATAANITIAYDKHGVPAPVGLGMFSSYYSFLKNYIVPMNNNGTFTNFASRYNGTLVPTFSEYAYYLGDRIANFDWFPDTPYENSTQYVGLVLPRIQFANLATHVSLSLQRGLEAHNMVAEETLGWSGGLIMEEYNRGRGGGGFRGGGYTRGGGGFNPPCDPREPECINCRLLTDSIDLIVEIGLNCVEDLSNTKRFNLNVTALDLERTNTFAQPDDPKTCDDASLSVEDTDRDPTGFTTWLVDALGVRDFLARMGCYLTNTDFKDPQSPLFYLHKLVTCDPVNDGPCHRGRAGLGLWKSLLWVTLGMVVVFFFLSTVLSLPVASFISITVWLLTVLSVAYFWSPMCMLPLPPVPLPVLPDCLMDDIYFEATKDIPEDCYDYDEEIFDSPEGANCTKEGRRFPDCRDHDFDLLGVRTTLYHLRTIWPESVDYLQTTSLPLFSWMHHVEPFASALNDIDEIHGSPIGEYCVRGRRSLVLVITLLLIFVLLSLTSVLAAVALTLVVIVALVASLYAQLLAIFVASVVRHDARWNSYYVPRDRQ